jgi:membrane-associated protease RseP (regulator of RpoE activity)
MTNIHLEPKLRAEDVEVLTTEPSRNAIPLGEIALGGRARHNHQKLINKARKEAAKIGADFIHIVKTDTEYHSYVAPGVGSFSGQGYGQGNWNAYGSYIGPRAGTVVLPIVNVIAGVYTPSKSGLNFDENMLKEIPHKFIVTGFDLNSKAEKAGLKVGDQVIGMDGIDISDKEKCTKLIWELKLGQKVKYTVLREGKKHEFEVERIEN